MSHTISRRTLIGAGAAALGAAVFPAVVRAAAGKVDQIGVDYAYYNPPSLVLKKFGWLESALAPHGTKVNWVLSLGSNKANQFLASGDVQFGSTAGSAAFLARANGSPIQTVYLYTRPEWTALVVAKDSPLKLVHDLKGKKVAATKGTDPWFFLLRSLHSVGLSERDVEIVELQHPDGRTALERGQVDAWAGLDPHMAASQLQAGSRLLYRNIDFNTYGALNVREDFLRDHADLVDVVLKTYERARRFAIKNPDETAKILAEASNLPVDVAAIEIKQRTQYPDPVPGLNYRRAVQGVIPVVRAEKLTLASVDLDKAIDGLVNTSAGKVALGHA